MSFEQTLMASGLMPRYVVADGKWRRCATSDKPKKRNGAYVLYPDGRGYWRNWALDDGVNAWTDSSATRAAPIDPRLIQRQRATERAERMRAIHGARVRWQRAEPMRVLHPYIKNKGLSAAGCAGLRVYDDTLLVPVYWGASLTSLQTIQPDGEKKFWFRAPTKGGSFVLQRQHPGVTAVCEGLATGLAIYQSVRHASVIVAFNADNIIKVVQRLMPTGSVVICADNDHGTQAKRGTNPGIEKALNAAELIGAGVAWPEGIEGSDWADALSEWGDPGTKRIERQILMKAKYVMPP